MSTAGLLFGLEQRVTRRAYLAGGLLLTAVKLALDTAIVYGFTSKTWSPVLHFVPTIIFREKELGSVPASMHVTLVVAAMPFLWVGVSMSVRRAADAGVSPWLGVGFLVPLANYLVIAALALLPTSDRATWGPPLLGPYRAAPAEAGAPPPPNGLLELPSRVRAALLGLAACIGLGLSMLCLSVYGLGTYGAALFFATPFTMGAVSALLYNTPHVRPLGRTIGLALIGVSLTGAVVLLFAIEGLLCLAMTFPLAALIATIGAIIGWSIATHARRDGRESAALLVILPALTAFEAQVAEPTSREVTTSIEIDAPPERVWPNIIGFSELPAPPSWIYRLGIAYPMRARIDGSGVGAVRHCEFSTGAFVEPITVWDPPRRLAFDVTSQPPSMTEWSPYRNLNAPHIEGYMVSRGGEFRLVPLPGGRTRVEGTTHYTLSIFPETYWVIYAEVLLHGIHGRVLEHIKRLSE